MADYPHQAASIAERYEGWRAMPWTIPAFWHVGAHRPDSPIRPMPGRWLVYVIGPTVVVVHVLIPA
jgi:hypothetical protein